MGVRVHAGLTGARAVAAAMEVAAQHLALRPGATPAADVVRRLLR